VALAQSALTASVGNPCLNNRKEIMYTAQINAHGNVIVCKGDTVRNSYRIIFTGTYAHCMMVKEFAPFNDYTNRRTSV